MLKRIIYLGYYLKELDWVELNRYIDHVSETKKISRFILWKESLLSVFKYNISIVEYFLFRFYEISHEERENYAGTGYMYEYQRLMNPKKSRRILIDKRLFLKTYKKFVKHPFVTLEEIMTSKKTDEVLANKSGKIVLKKSNGQCGIGIEVQDVHNFNKQLLYKRLKDTGNDMVEAFVEQHANLNTLSPSGLNTIRIITQLDKNDEVKILGARLRLTINSVVDNLAAGNLAAPIELKSGKVNGPGVYSDIIKTEEHYHPVTKIKIDGFQIPFWEETIKMITEAALLNKENRSVGWDVAITEEGPELIEGNHDWCKLLWQLPIKKGLKPVLEKYKQEYIH